MVKKDDGARVAPCSGSYETNSGGAILPGAQRIRMLSPVSAFVHDARLRGRAPRGAGAKGKAGSWGQAGVTDQVLEAPNTAVDPWRTEVLDKYNDWRNNIEAKEGAAARRSLELDIFFCWGET